MAEKLNTPAIYLKLGNPVIRLVDVSGNILEACKVTSPHGREDECAKFIISDIEDAYGLRDTMTIGTEYTLSFWLKSDVSGYVRTSGEGTFKASSEWQKCVVTFDAEDEDLVLSFDTEGTYYIYHIQLELGNTATDYRPANEDVDEGISTAQKTAEEAQEEAEKRKAELVAFIDGDYAKAMETISTQLDKKAETWRQTIDPSLDWKDEKTRQLHVGDLWLNPSTKESYIYTSSGASTEAVTEPAEGHLAEPRIALYSWEPTFEIPQQVFDDIDGKAQIFSSQPTHPYYVKDLWVEGKDGDIKVCIEKSTEEGFKAEHWVLASRYMGNAELQNWITKNYDPVIQEVKLQLDGKAETWCQTTDPSLEWDTEDKRRLHVGDLWLNPNTKESYIYTASISDRKTSTPASKQLAIPYIGLYSWKPTFEIPQSVFQDIDGKAQIFATQPEPPYFENDLWTQGADGDIYVCITDRTEGNFVAEDWKKASGASRTATDYLKAFEDSLIVGDVKASKLGNNVLIDGTNKKVAIRDGETELASFDEDDIRLGNNANQATIHLCGDTGFVSANSLGGLSMYSPKYLRLATVDSTEINSWTVGNEGWFSNVKFIQKTLDDTGAVAPEMLLECKTGTASTVVIEDQEPAFFEIDTASKTFVKIGEESAMLAAIEPPWNIVNQDIDDCPKRYIEVGQYGISLVFETAKSTPGPQINLDKDGTSISGDLSVLGNINITVDSEFEELYTSLFG